MRDVWEILGAVFAFNTFWFVVACLLLYVTGDGPWWLGPKIIANAITGG